MATLAAGSNRAHLARAVIVSGLAGCVLASVAIGSDRVVDPLTLFLAACALLATLTAPEVDDENLFSGSFVCAFFAMAVLGTVPGVAVVVAAELGASFKERIRLEAAAINVLSVALTMLAAGSLLDAVWGTGGRSGGAFSLVLAAVAGLALVGNIALYGGLRDLLGRAPLGHHLRTLSSFLPIMALGIFMTVATTVAYRDAGFTAAGALVLVLIAFNYSFGLLSTARREQRRATKLAADRQDLVVIALDAEDRERRLLAERLHDGPMQTLLSVRQDLETDATPDRSVHLAAVEDCLRQLRGAVHDLHPAVMQHSGLSAAIASIASGEAERGGFQADIRVATEPAPPQDQLLFSVARELLRNVATHARARQVEVRLDADEDRIRLSVADDGDGIDVEAASRALTRGHIGLASSTQRVEAAGGRLSVSRREPRGTRVEVEVPVVASAT